MKPDAIVLNRQMAETSEGTNTNVDIRKLRHSSMKTAAGLSISQTDNAGPHWQSTSWWSIKAASLRD